MRQALLLVGLTLFVSGCGDAVDSPTEPGVGGRDATAFGVRPAVGDGQLEASTAAALDSLLDEAVTGALDREALGALAASNDARVGWVVSDLLRFYQDPRDQRDLLDAFTELAGRDVSGGPGFEEGPWVGVTDHLIAWDLPAPPDYRERKAKLFLTLEPGWEPFFSDAESDIDWRLVSWGGVGIDDRSPGDDAPCPRGCIPALDDPALSSAAGGGWYPDERSVFGVEVGGEAVALPKNIMEVHEMVNMTLGGRRLGIPYCTLCGSAQAYFTDADPERDLVLRTSGLLSRSNKVMYELGTQSVFDTFSGEALSGPLHDRGVVLDQATVVTSTWGDWRRAHPKTRIIAEDGGIGREYPLDPLGGRDDNGPIFPVGDVDSRLPAQTQVVGVSAPGGKPVAFPAEEARQALAAGKPVSFAGVRLLADGDGVRAQTAGGRDLAAHQAFWFAWSQFHPGTTVWALAR